MLNRLLRNSKILLPIAAIFASAAVGSASPAFAQATQTWVSGAGADSNDCSRTTPCLTFAGALAKTGTGGEISCRDPGDFGAVTITKAISIICDNVEAGIQASGATAITINAGANDAVQLSGLYINGLGSGAVGVNVTAAATVRIANSTIRGFQSATGHAILVNPSSGSIKFIMDNVSASENGGPSGGSAVAVQPTGGANVSAVFTRIQLTNNNGAGFRLDGTGGSIAAVVRGSMSSSPSGTGLSAIGTNSVNVLSDRSAFIANTTGIAINGTGVSVRLARSSVNANAVGLSVTGGTIASYGDNQIAGNASNGTAPSSVSEK